MKKQMAFRVTADVQQPSPYHVPRLETAVMLLLPITFAGTMIYLAYPAIHTFCVMITQLQPFH